MNQTELLGFIIEKGQVSSGEAAAHFGVPIPFAHQVLRRLEDKGLLRRNGGPYRFTFGLSPEAQEKLDGLNGDPKGYGWIFLLGLAVGLLIGFGVSKKGSSKHGSPSKTSQKKHP